MEVARSTQESPRAAPLGRRLETRASGFTLVEILIALAIAATMVALLLANLPGTTARARLTTAAHDVAMALRTTRAVAIERNRLALFRADVGSASYQPAGEGVPRKLPRGVGIALDTTTDQILNPRLGTIRFFPDGSSSGGGITVFDGREGYVVLVDWATGAVTILPDQGGRASGRSRNATAVR